MTDHTATENAFAQLAEATASATGRSPRPPRDNSTEAKLARAKARFEKLQQQLAEEEKLAAGGPRPQDIKRVGRFASKLNAAIRVITSEECVEAFETFGDAGVTDDELIAAITQSRDFLATMATCFDEKHKAMLAEFSEKNPGVEL